MIVAIKETKNESGTAGTNSGMGTGTLGVNKEDRQSLMRSKCISKVGEKMFQEVYDYLSYHRRKKTPESKIQKHLRDNYDKGVLSVIFDVDQLVFMELGNQ
jgi:hypothetical protein